MTHRKRYDQWIADAALGALDPRRERELLSHLERCRACREAYQHARELAADVDRGVESLVTGEPSPHFATRFRARIAELQPVSRSIWPAWKPVSAVLASAVVLAALVMFFFPKHRAFAPNEVRPNPNTTSAAHIQAPVAAESSATNPPRRARQSRVRGGYPPAPGLARRTTPSRMQVASRSGTHDGPDSRALDRHAAGPSSIDAEVLVPPGQLAAVMQLAADIRSGRIDGKRFLAEQAEAQKNMQKPIDIAPIDIAPIEIAPIEIPPLPTKPPELPSDSTAP